MRYATLAGITLFFALCAMPCAAQSIPPGSYQQTCTDVSVYGSTLSARCQDRNGEWRSTRLTDFQNCRSEIANDNGSLVCSQGGGYQQRGNPRGDYQQTCRNLYTQGNRLQAECQRRDGSWRQTTLDDIGMCRGSIINNDGKLMCGSSGNPRSDARREWRNGLPYGDYIETCRNAAVSGYRLDAECEKKNGQWRHTTLKNIDQCSAPIANDNGHLVCPKNGSGPGYYYGDQGGGPGYGGQPGYGDRSGWQGGIPPGTYTQTCRNIHVDGDRLVAECQARDYSWRQTSLDDVSRCTSAPANDNGYLMCGR